MIVFDELHPTVALALTYGLDILGAILILIAGWILAGWASRLVARSSERNPNIDRALSGIFARVVRVGILVFTVIAVLNQFGIATTSLVALLGAAGLAIGLALQGTLSNVASGVMLLVLRPFKIGDAIDAGGIAGLIEDIGLFVTRMKSFDGIPMFVPNSKLWGAEIKNFSQSQTRRIDMVFSIGYNDNIDEAIHIINNILAEDERVLPEPEPLIAVGELAENSINIWVRPWTKAADFFKTKLDLTKRIKERFDEEGISIPFPQRDIRIIQGEPVSGTTKDLKAE